MKEDLTSYFLLMANPAVVYAIPFVLVILVSGEIMRLNPKNYFANKRKKKNTMKR